MKHLLQPLILTLCLLSCKTEKSTQQTAPATPSETTQKSSAKSQSPDAHTITLAFGSCNDEDKPQTMWDEIIKESPALWIWLGDNIYGDTDDMKVMQKKYDIQNGHEEYARFKKSVKINGIWDDHDYGLNDGGKEFKAKKGSQQVFLDFMDAPADDPRRSREGIYGSQHLQFDDFDVNVFYLDTRYFRDELKGGRGKYDANMEGTVLGEAQWLWLETELKNTKADVNIIASSIQVVSYQHGWEKWGNFPNERRRLLDLIVDNHVSHPVILSGDRHTAEISELDWKGVSICDITSSGLTNVVSKPRPETNEHRVAGSELIFQKNYGTLEIKMIDDEIKIVGKIKAAFDNTVVEHVID